MYGHWKHRSDSLVQMTVEGKARPGRRKTGWIDHVDNIRNWTDWGMTVARARHIIECRRFLRTMVIEQQQQHHALKKKQSLRFPDFFITFILRFVHSLRQMLQAVWIDVAINTRKQLTCVIFAQLHSTRTTSNTLWKVQNQDQQYVFYWKSIE